MRILHVDSGRAWRGGQAQVLRLMEGLRTGGHEQRLAAWPAGALARAAVEQGFSVREIAVRGDLDLAAAVAIAGEARGFGARVIHAHTAHAHAVAMLAARIAGVRGRVVTRRVVLPVGRNAWSRMKYRDRSVRYVAISGAVASALEKGGVDLERIRVVYSGVPADGVPRASDPAARLRARNLLGLSGDVPALGIVGALTGEKGQEVAVTALRDLPADVKLVLIGDGPDRQRIEETARSLGVSERVVLAGFRPDTGGLWPAFDLALAPSRHEGLGTAVLEAMAAGVPVVASAIDAFREVLKEGAAGELVPPGDAKMLARAAGRVLCDMEMRARMARAGLDRVKDYSTENMVRGTESVYLDLEVRK